MACMPYQISVHYSYSYPSFTLAATDKGIMYDAVISLTITILLPNRPSAVRRLLGILRISSKKFRVGYSTINSTVCSVDLTVNTIKKE